MKKLRFIYLILLLELFSQNILAQDYPLEISVSPKGYFTSFLGEFYENPSKYLNVLVNSTNAESSKQIYFLIKFEQISPDNTILMATKASWRPTKAISISPNKTTYINTSQMQDQFANISDDDFNITGFNSADYGNGMEASTRIPEGTYRVCVYACDFNEPINSIKPLSNPNGGCGIINICYKASQPEWVKPFRSDIDPDDEKAHNIEPKKNIRFEWNTPTAGCPMNLNKIKYDFKLVKVINQQSVEEAIKNNSSLINEENISNRYFNLDTVKNANILEKDKKYAAQITAKIEDNSLFFENEGKSKICWFTYKKVEKKDSLEMVQLTPTDVDCGEEVPDDKNPIEVKKGDEVQIGKFTLKISSITSSKKKKYSGEGSIKGKLWESSVYTINAFNVKVKFKDIRVNKDKKVFDGSATGVFENNDFGLDAEFTSDNKYLAKGYNIIKEKLGDTIKAGVNKANIEKVGNFIGLAKAASATFAETPQKLPLGLRINDDATDNHGFNIAVSDMFFTPKGAMFSIVLLMHVPEINRYLAFGASDLCMTSPFKNGKISLLADVEIPLGSENYKLFVEGSTQSKDNLNTTFVKWTTDGFDGVQLAARLELPKDEIINLKDKTKPVSLQVSGFFRRWGDWMANISMQDGEKFAFADLDDFEFTIKDATYDHSLIRNVPDFKKAIKDLGKGYAPSDSTNEFQGLFIKNINVAMPNWIENHDDDKDSTKVNINIKNTFYDNFGLNLNIVADSVLNINSGKVGGWGFSIDSINIKVIKSSLREGSMKGKFELPFASTEKSGYIGYRTSINKKANNGKLSYDFIVKPEKKDGLNYEFLQYFKATLTKDSNISVEIADKGPRIKAELNGKLNIKVNDFNTDLTGVNFQGLRIANYDKKGKPGFDFKWGTWSLGSGDDKKSDNNSSNGNKNSNNSNSTSNGGSNNSGPNYDDFYYYSDEEDSSDDTFNTSVSFKVGPFKAGIGKPDFGAEDVNINNATISLGLPIIMSLDKFGEGETGEEMCAVRTKLKFKFPLDYNAPDSNAPYYGLEMPTINYSGTTCELEDIAIRGEFGPVKIYGLAKLYNKHETYGDGFRGSAKVEFPMGIKAYSTVQFGEINNMNYWYADGGATFGNVGIEVAGLFAINGFGGGVYKNMLRNGDITYIETEDSEGNKKANKPKKETNAEKETNEAKIHEMENLENYNPDAMSTTDMSTLGAGISGVEYVPQKGGFGLYAKLDFCASNSQGGYKTFYGSGKFEMNFKDGGFNSAIIDANVSAINNTEAEGIVNADCLISYNYPNRHFYLDALVDVDSDVQGGPKAKAPFLIDIERNDFYIALGEPVFNEENKTIHLNLIDFEEGDSNNEGVHAKMFVDAYILGGNAIPSEYNMPAPPDQVAEFMNMSSMTDYRKNTESVKKDGFMLGARLNGDFGFTYGPIYGDLDILAGIDVELINAENILCNDGSDIGGFNGYYARGQAYSYLNGSVGAKLKLFGKRKKFSLCDITAGAMVQAGFKDPSWFKGKAKVRGRILGGAIKFNTSARFKIGKICEPPVDDPLDDLVIIESIEPAVEVEPNSNGSFSNNKINEAKNEANNQKSSIFTIPQVACNVEMERLFEIVYDENDKTVRREYVFKIDQFSYKCIETGEMVNCNNIIGKTGEKFALRTEDMLKPNSTYEIDITVRAWEIINGEQQNPIDENGNHYVSRKRQLFYFKTDNMPNFIVRDNIITSYPIENQFETFPKENKYRIIMDANVDYLFKDENGQNFSPKELIGEYINISNPTKPNIVFNYIYHNGGYGVKPNIEFDMNNYYNTVGEPIMLNKGDIYKVKLYVPKHKEKDVKFDKANEKIKIGSINDSETDNENFGKQDNSKSTTSQSLGINIIENYTNNNINLSSNNISVNINSLGSLANLTSNSNNYSQTNTYSSSSSSLNNANIINNFITNINNNSNINKAKEIMDNMNVKVVIKDSSTGEISTSQENANLKLQTNIDRLKQIISDKGKRMDFELIYENHFRVSEYNSLKNKFRNISANGVGAVSTTAGSISFSLRDRKGHVMYNNNKEISRCQSNNTIKTATFTFPEYTTCEEVDNYYAYKNISSAARAQRQPSMIQFEALLYDDGRENNIINRWNKVSILLNKIITTPGVEFKLPLTPEYRGSNRYPSELNMLNTYVQYINGTDAFEPPLSSNEISCGRINRNRKTIRFSYVYKNIIAYYNVNHSLALFSDFILNKHYNLDRLTNSDKSYFRVDFHSNRQIQRESDFEIESFIVPGNNNAILNVCNKIYPSYKTKLVNLKQFWNSYKGASSNNYRNNHYNQIRLGEHYIQYYFVKPENYYKLWKNHNPENYLDRDNNNRININIIGNNF